MTAIVDLDPPARQLTQLLNGVTDDQLSASTPCEEYTVADLLEHISGFAIAFRNAATKTTGAVDPPAGGASPDTVSGAGLHPDWRSRIPRQLDDLVAAWRVPSAWEGMTEAGGVTLPAEMMGRVALNELVLHGWDLARGTGQSFECDPTSAEACYELIQAATAPGEGAPEGLFGPAVEVASDAPLFDRVLGLGGRDPSWTAATHSSSS
ncbi:MAG: TIGR03086 family metal-binding protein [Pseudonocardiaceae bacterium]